MVNTEFLRALSAGTGKAKLLTPQLATDQSYVLPLQGGVLDWLGPIGNAEVALTAAGAAAISTWTHCTATSANYALTFPALSASWGLFLGVTIDPTSTYLVTLTAAGADTIDGVATRIMWANESAVLFADQSAGCWVKVAGKTVPMAAALGFTSNQTFAASTPTLLAWTTSIYNSAPVGFQVTATPKIVILRPGKYLINFFAESNSSNSAQGYFWTDIYKNSSQVARGGTWVYATSTAGWAQLSRVFTLAAADIMQPYGVYTGGSYATSWAASGAALTQFEVIEIPTW